MATDTPLLSVTQFLLDKDLQYEEELIVIHDCGVRKLWTKEIMSVKVQWKNRPVKQATREIEKDM